MDGEGHVEPAKRQLAVLPLADASREEECAFACRGRAQEDARTRHIAVARLEVVTRDVPFHRQETPSLGGYPGLI